jgi:hypothetical protein
MSLDAPASYHLDLYRYWLSKRGTRLMPARRDIDPADISVLLSYLEIIDKVDGRLRYRLVGTSAAMQLGRDLTGKFVGSYVRPLEFAAKLRAAYESVFSTGRPVFVTGEYVSGSGSVHYMSQLVLPLSDNGIDVNMVIFVRIARFNAEASRQSGHLDGVPFRVCGVRTVSDTADIETYCSNWERQNASDGAGAAVTQEGVDGTE